MMKTVWPRNSKKQICTRIRKLWTVLSYVSGVNCPIVTGFPILCAGLGPVGHLLEQGSALLASEGCKLSAI